MLPKARSCQSGRLIGEGEGESPLVAEPCLVHVLVVAREMASDLPAPEVDSEVAPGRAVRADRIARLEVEGASGEPVCGGGQGSDRTDLDRVAGERTPEVLPRGDGDLFGGPPVEQLDEPVP